MKRIYILFFVMLLIPSLAFGGKVDESQMMKGAKLSEPQAELPTVVVGGNTIIGNITQPGWPIIINASMSGEEDPALEVPANLKVKLLDQNGNAAAVNFEPVTREDNSQRFWIAPETATQNLAPGQYTITLEPEDGLSIESGELEVESNPDAISLLGLLKIQVSLLTGKDDEAMAEANQLIAKDPENLNAWVAKGDMLMFQDLPDEASVAYETATELQAKTGHESVYLQERMRRAFFRSLEKRGVITRDENTQE